MCVNSDKLKSFLPYVAVFVSILALLDVKWARSCEHKRNLTNEMIELAVEISHTSRSRIGLGAGYCYPAHGKPALEIKPDPSWNENYDQMREDIDLLIQKVRAFGNMDIVQPLQTFNNAVRQLVTWCDSESYSDRWRAVKDEKNALVRDLGLALEQCYPTKEVSDALEDIVSF